MEQKCTRKKRLFFSAQLLFITTATLYTNVLPPFTHLFYCIPETHNFEEEIRMIRNHLQHCSKTCLIICSNLTAFYQSLKYSSKSIILSILGGFAGAVKECEQRKTIVGARGHICTLAFQTNTRIAALHVTLAQTPQGHTSEGRN